MAMVEAAAVGLMIIIEEIKKGSPLIQLIFRQNIGLRSPPIDPCKRAADSTGELVLG